MGAVAFRLVFGGGVPERSKERLSYASLGGAEEGSRTQLEEEE